jgi:hypothetical protein
VKPEESGRKIPAGLYFGASDSKCKEYCFAVFNSYDDRSGTYPDQTSWTTEVLFIFIRAMNAALTSDCHRTDLHQKGNNVLYLIDSRITMLTILHHTRPTTAQPRQN